MKHSRLSVASVWSVALVLAPLTEATGQEILQSAGSEHDVRLIDRELARKIDFVFRRWDRRGSPGMAVGIVDGGELVYARGYGFADLEHEIPITPQTVFHVASVSKQFTAFAVALLASKGELSLDDDIRRHVPEFPDLGRRITLRHLIHHTSGIRDQWTLLTLAGWRLDDVITRPDILGLLFRQQELNFEPGSEYVYSNSGYTLLAETVLRTTGKSFREWSEEAVFSPLGMSDTHAHDDHRMIVRNRAESYQRARGGYRRSPLNYSNVGATSLFTTVGDLGIWASNLMAPAFAPDVVAEMARPTELTTGFPLNYGFGLSVSADGGRRIIEHGGADAGFRSHFAVFPDDDMAIVVLANAAEVNAGQLAHRAAAVFLETRGPIDVTDEVSSAAAGDRRADELSASPGPADVEISEEDLAPLEGVFWHRRTDLVRSTRSSRGDLWYRRAPGNATRLRYVGGGVFRMADVEPPIEVRFESSGDDAVPAAAMIVESTNEPPLRLERIAPVADPLSFADYTGLYASDEVGVTVRLLIEDGKLALRHPRHGTIRLRPVAADRFDSPEWWLGSLRFTRDDAGEVAGFRSSSGRVRHLLFRRDDTLGEPSRFRVPAPRPSPGAGPPGEGSG